MPSQIVRDYPENVQCQLSNYHSWASNHVEELLEYMKTVSGRLFVIFTMVNWNEGYLQSRSHTKITSQCVLWYLLWMTLHLKNASAHFGDLPTLFSPASNGKPHWCISMVLSCSRDLLWNKYCSWRRQHGWKVSWLDARTSSYIWVMK